MKYLKKISVILLALAIVLSLSSFAFAAQNTEIVITGGISGSEYSAYRILIAQDLGNDKFAYTLNDTYAQILKDASGKTTEDEIVLHITNLDKDALAAFAGDVYAAIVAAGITADCVTTNDTLSVEQGYYLIAETKLGSAADTYSLAMLATAGEEHIEVTTKEDVPTVTKTVLEINDSTGNSAWGFSADYDIGDIVAYEIAGTVSNKYASYKSYYYSFNDTMDTGLTYNDDAKVYVVNGEEKVEVTEQFSIVKDETGFTATANLKELTGVSIDAGTKIVVAYTATLNENAVSGVLGNKNEVYLEYENDPYREPDGDPETPDEPEEPSRTNKVINIVFTYDAIINKVDKEHNALEGAGFMLYKWFDDVQDWVAVSEEITGVTIFCFPGVDVGKYKLVETTVPEGYNKCDDVIFEVVATYDTTVTPHALTGLEVKDEDGVIVSGTEDTAIFNVNLNEGEVTTEIINLSGTQLPATGGIGTPIFYIAGAILVLGVAVLLITKRRMRVEG